MASTINLPLCAGPSRRPSRRSARFPQTTLLWITGRTLTVRSTGEDLEERQENEEQEEEEEEEEEEKEDEGEEE